MVSAAGIIAGNIGGNLTRKFPLGSRISPTEASSLILTQWKKFALYANDMETAALNLAGTAHGRADLDLIAAAFGRLAKTSTTCHETFRVKS
ncbi:cytochrome c [Roseibium sp.]|uniref:cytochrome c n=1 Tax=Roseibium sp. TaxID=1936156 RepID=UPI003D11B441